MKRIFMSTLICLLMANAAFAQASLVAQVKDALILQGQTFTTNCDAFEITRRVAWLLRAEGAQLVGKTDAQNGCVFGTRKYSHDVIAFPTGWRDILHSAGPPANVNEPAWDLTGTSPDAPLYAPFESGGVVVPPILPPVVTVPPPPLEPSMCIVNGVLFTHPCSELILDELRKHEAAEAVERQQAAAFRAAVGTEYKKFFVAISKYVLPAIGALFAGRAMAK